MGVECGIYKESLPITGRMLIISYVYALFAGLEVQPDFQHADMRLSGECQYEKEHEPGMKIITFDFEEHGDERGILISLEENKNIPFDIKRCYYMYNTQPGVSRGHHAHKSLEQVLVCVSGECKILLDDGKTRETVVLDRPNKGLYLSHLIWREMFDFSEDAVLMVLASQLYDESDYIRSYDEFLQYVQTKNGEENGL